MSESLSNIDKAIMFFEDQRANSQKEDRQERRPFEEQALTMLLKDIPGVVFEFEEDTTCAKIKDVVFTAKIYMPDKSPTIYVSFKTITDKKVFKFFRVVKVETITKTISKRSSIETVLKTHRAAQVCEAWLDCGIVPSKEQIEQMY
jgi:hypothetical protein